MNKDQDSEHTRERPLEPEDQPRLLAAILGAVGDAILVTEAQPTDEPGPKIVYANESFARMTGYTAEEIVGKTPRILQGPQTDRARLDEIRAALTKREPVRVDLLNYRKDGTQFWVEVDIEPVTDEHGNHTHWVSVQRDITDRRRQQEALRESEERLRAVLVQHASDIITTVEADGTIRYESPALERVLGYKPEELVDKSILDYIHPEDVDRAATELGKIQEEPGVRGPIEVRFRHNDGTWRCLEGITNNLLDDPAVGGIVINSRDITERKQVEEQLRSAEEKYRSLVEQVPAIIYIHEPTPTYQSTTYDYEVSYISPRVEEILGYPPHAFVENRSFWNELIHPDDRPEVLAEDERTDKSGEPFLMEYRMVTHDGRVVWIREEAALIHSPKGEPLYWQGVMTDITEQKLAEEDSRRSEVKFRSVVQNFSEIVKITEADGTLRYASPAFGRIFGYDSEKAVGINVLDYVHPEDLPRVRKETEKTLQNPGVNSNITEYRFQHADGSWRWVESVGTYLLDNPAIGGVIINVRDVTERKQAAEKLRSAEERYRTLVEQIPAAIYIQKPIPGEIASYHTSYMSSRIEEILGYSAQRFVEDQDFWYESVHPEDLAEVLAENARTDETSEPFFMEYRMICRDERVVWVREEALLIRSSEGEPLYWQGVLIDVTERKLQQEALKKSEEKYRSVVENIREVIFRTDAEGRYTFLNPAWEDVTGFTVEESLGKSYLEFIHPEDLQRNPEDFEQMGNHEGDYTGYQARFQAKDGSPREVEIQFRERFDEKGNLTSTSGTLDDITERKKAERDLQESEQRFRSLVQNASDLITVVDADGTITYESPSKERILGYGPQELAGRPVLEHVHPDDLEQVSVELGNVLARPGYLSEEPTKFWYRHADGTWRYLEALAANLLDDPGVGSVVITSRDITERKRLEEQLFYQAFHDPLTGLPNRSSLQRRFEQVAGRSADPPGARRRDVAPGEVRYVAVLFLDLDGFKEVNDYSGHAAGDELLQAVAERLQNVVRPQDTVARLGGDEFCVLLAGVSGTAETIRIVQRLKTSLEAPFSVAFAADPDTSPTSTSVVSLSASIGIAVSEPGGVDSL